MQPSDLTDNQPLEENPPMEWTALKDKRNPQDWRVEGIDFGNEGEVTVIIFSGPKAQPLAEEYAKWKNSPEQRKPVRKAM